MDIGPYWYGPLGRVFALSQGDIEIEAMKVIRKEFGLGAKGRWDEDERVRRSLYKEQHTYHSHGSYPRADNLHFYCSYHAMMIVAGRLLATTPTHRNPDWDKDDPFADWLSRHDLTRRDGRWLWDRRDTEPLSIIKVQIERCRRYKPYESVGKYDDERTKTIVKLYLLGEDGKFRTL